MARFIIIVILLGICLLTYSCANKDNYVFPEFSEAQMEQICIEEGLY